MIRVSNIKVDVDHRQQVLPSLLRKLGVSREQIVDYRIYRESIDARRAGMIHFVYTIDVELAGRSSLLSHWQQDPNISIAPEMDYHYPTVGRSPLSTRPVIIGTGPAGLFAGLLLAEMGYRPLLLERGGDVDQRVLAVEQFWRSGRLNPSCNVQFGEGGAGTFSDGKLTSMIKDQRGRKVLQDLIAAGAPEEIIYSQKPHVGTDRLRSVVRNLRQRIVSLGGEVRWHAQVTEVAVSGQRVSGVVINGDTRLPTDLVVLAIGHSARDTFAMLHAQGVQMQPKPFSIGVRIEHPQSLIDQAQYKRFAGHKNLGAADYKLVYHSPSGRSAYTFCMCPGGEVVAAASEPGYLCTNGMSEYARDAKNANSALLIGVQPADYGSDHPLAGVEFQRRWERLAFELGGGDYRAPAQLVGDFLANRTSTEFGQVCPSYRLGVRLGDLARCLPPYAVQTMQEAIPEFGRKLKGFDRIDALLTGVETRSSSPIRILRGEDYQSNIGGLYPCGEGAGYAGGIISAAVDGLRVAEAIIQHFRPLG